MTVNKNRARRLQKLYVRMLKAWTARKQMELADDLAEFEVE